MLLNSLRLHSLCPHRLFAPSRLADANKALQTLVGVARASLLMSHMVEASAAAEATPPPTLLFAAFSTKTIPVGSWPLPNNPLQYLLVSTVLLTQANTLALRAGAQDRVPIPRTPSLAPPDLPRAQRIAALKMSSAAAGTLASITGVKLPDLSAHVREAPRRHNGAALLETMLGCVLDAYDKLAMATEVTRAPDNSNGPEVAQRWQQDILP